MIWMRSFARRSALTLAIAIAAASSAMAAPQEYEFQLVANQVRQGEAVISVRLIHRPTGRPVPDAVIYATRLDMAPEGMPTMTTPLAAMPGEEPGVYRFRTNLAMAGGWQLTLSARVQGEEGAVQQRLVLRATP